MLKYTLSMAIVIFQLSGCIKAYKETTAVCNGKLYIEVFNINPAGVDSYYLTDSLNFRLYVGKFDNEHENYSFTCKGDSITINKLSMSDTSRFLHVVETRFFSLSDLKKGKKFD
jgi:hypothetical protein